MFCLAALPSAPAQQPQSRSNKTQEQRTQEQDDQEDARPLTLDEGLAIIGAALDSRHHKAFSSDCSHFVHGLYQRAGFHYAYAPSSDLYAGVGEFRRVTHPQPGDLAVWRGHSGIVVNPAQHSFFSLLRSGPGVDSYDSPYWKRKGRPRFFRYVKTVPGRALSSSTRTASLRPSSLEDAEPHQAPTGDQEPEISEGAASERTSPASRVADPALDAMTPRVAVVNSIHPKPDRLAEAFIRACTEAEPNLRGRDLFHSAQRVIVFDHFTVKKVHVSGSQDWVDVQIDELAALTGGTGETHKHSERQRWVLTRRDKTTWELTPPRDVIYLPQPIAVRLLARQLAQLTENSPTPASRTKEDAELARVLDTLLQK